MKLLVLRLCPVMMSMGLLLGWNIEFGHAAETVRLAPLFARKLVTPPSRLSDHLQAVLTASETQSLSVLRAMLRQNPTASTNLLNPIRLYLYLDAGKLTPENRVTLEQLGVTIWHRHQSAQTTLLSVSVPTLQAVKDLGNLSFLRWVRTATESVVHPAMTRLGSVSSTGDEAMRAAELRTLLGLDGSGVRIGIISDSLVNLQESVNTGDLPATVEIVNGEDGSDQLQNTDEGRAMAEIIHDLAPGATLMFHSGFPTSLAMVAAIQALADAAADIIVDDLGFFTEPIFEDGPVAQAVQSVIDRGVLYVTAVGNSALKNYRAPYKEFMLNDGDGLNNLHDFGNADTTMAVRVRAGGSLLVVLQWPNRFDGTANTADYDLMVFDETGTTSACTVPGISGSCASLSAQLPGPAPPLEDVFIQNTGAADVTVNVVINRRAGDALPLHMLLNGTATILQHNVSSQSTFGHPCVVEALAVGAIDAGDPGFDTIESFSSQGPCEIYFPNRETRLKPDMAGADGVNTSLSSFAPFFGTSAAAPHVAAVAALLMEAVGGPQAVTNLQINNVLRLSAVDLDTAGPDSISGYGAVDAVQAANLLQAGGNTPPESTIVSPATDIVVVLGQATHFQGSCVDVEDDIPFTFAWDFGGAAAASTVQNPGAQTFSTPGEITVTFTCTDNVGLTDATPAVRTVTVNQAPQSRIANHGSQVVISAGDTLNFQGACDDPDNHAPFTFFWFFGGGGNLIDSTAQNPGNVRFNTPGDFVVTLTCADVLGTESVAADTLRVLVNPAAPGAGGGGCTLGAVSARTSLWSAFGNILLPLVVILIIRMWRFWHRRQPSSTLPDLM